MGRKIVFIVKDDVEVEVHSVYDQSDVDHALMNDLHSDIDTLLFVGGPLAKSFAEEYKGTFSPISDAP